MTRKLPEEMCLPKVAPIREEIVQELRKVIVGQDEAVEFLLVALVARGHVLLEGVPGLAKTLMVSALARTMALSFRRIQFTPDLMPADITGMEVMEEDRESGRRQWRFLEGPVFANMVLADEINRTAPRTQAALLEAMQEHRVTVGRTSHTLPDPFFVLATQNPIEQEGTYPLPEAQQDRFLFKVLIPYPDYEDERRIACHPAEKSLELVRSVLESADLTQLSTWAEAMPCAEHLVDYAVRLVRATRVPNAVPEVARDLQWGAGPRAVQCLVRAARARALLAGRSCVERDDLTTLAFPVLRHRIILSFLAQSDGLTPDDVVAKLLRAVPFLPSSSGDHGRN